MLFMACPTVPYWITGLWSIMRDLRTAGWRLSTKGFSPASFIGNPINSLTLSLVDMPDAAADIPVAGDDDGDGKTDIDLRRPGERYWLVKFCNASALCVEFYNIFLTPIFSSIMHFYIISSS